MDPRRAEAALAADRDATRARLQALTAELQALISAAAGSNLDDEHDPEGATIAFERQQLAALRDQAQRQLDEIEHALGRLAAGTYGVCAACGRPIGAERLAARPFVRFCVADAVKGDASWPG